ncbi:hypothetical protein CR492_15080 [Methylocella silvestris]|uniref:DUF1311 domain-containing protein n=2 Tax=Methylocella silvestris TaxID=199596 RepID=A0A2J7TED4_METSI|nr:hypothetical protein CR492_15080 [Methylocella silvestris]
MMTPISRIAPFAGLFFLVAASPSHGQTLVKCPVEDRDPAQIGQATQDAPSCAQAYEIMNVCRSNTNGDAKIAQIVVDKCEKIFVPALDEPTFKAYHAARDSCARRFSQRTDAAGTSFQSTCEAGVAVVFAHRAELAAMRALRDPRQPRTPAGAPAPEAPPLEPPRGAPFGGLGPRP